MSQPLSSTVVGSYPQPEWLIDREALGSHSVPRVRVSQAWRIPEPYLREAQDDATVVAIRDMERAGIDTITDGEIRRESYSNRFATALDGVDADNPATIHTAGGEARTVPRIVAPVRWRGPVEVGDIEFLRAHTERKTKITLPGPFTMAQQASNEAYDDPDELVMDFAAAVNQEALALQAAGADVIQLDEPWLRNDPDAARRIAVAAIDRALDGLSVTTVVHLCFGYAALVGAKNRNRYDFLGELSDSVAEQISIEAAQPRLDLGQLSELSPKVVVLGVIDLGDDRVETPEQVADRIRAALAHMPAERIVPAPDCGMKYLPRARAFAKLQALSAGAALVRSELYPPIYLRGRPVREVKDPVVVTMRLCEGEFHLRVAEQPGTRAERHRVHEQVKLVHEAVGEHRPNERPAAADVDATVDLILETADRVRAVGTEDRRVVPVGALERRRHDVLRRLVHERSARILIRGAARPGRGELLVSLAPEQDRLARAHDPPDGLAHLRIEPVFHRPSRRLEHTIEAYELVYQDLAHGDSRG